MSDSTIFFRRGIRGGLVFVCAAGMVAAIACGSGQSAECIEAAEKAGVPPRVIEQLRVDYEDLHDIQKITLPLIMRDHGLSKVCPVVEC